MSQQGTLSGMDDGHFLNLGVVVGGSILLLTSFAGGALFVLSWRHWRREKERERDQKRG